MSDEDKKRFIEAVTGAGGKIDSKAAAALIAAAASGGDPEIANKVGNSSFIAISSTFVSILEYNLHLLCIVDH